MLAYRDALLRLSIAAMWLTTCRLCIHVEGCYYAGAASAYRGGCVLGGLGVCCTFRSVGCMER